MEPKQSQNPGKTKRNFRAGSTAAGVLWPSLSPESRHAPARSSGASASLRGPSTDGIDVDSSQNVAIRKCYISTGDDDIALKGSKGPRADQDPDSPPVENILVEDCEIGDGNGLITCGSEATIVRNVTARNCVMSGRATLLTLKLRPDTPQHYEHITMDGIKLAGRRPPPERGALDAILRPAGPARAEANGE